MPIVDMIKYRPAVTHRPFGRTAGVWIDILAGALCILPLLLTAHLPLSDLPNHLARQYVLRDWATSPALQQIYFIHWDLVPNLALELFVIAARQVMSIDMAVRAFCITTMLMLFLGTRSINLSLSGGTSRAYRIAPLLCYGGPFQYGFVSYCFGIGLALVLFGTWLHLRGRSVATKATFLIVSGFALMLCHFAAFGLFAIAIGICEAGDGVSATGFRRPLSSVLRVLLPIACLTPVFLLFVVLSPTTGAVATNAVSYSTLHERLRGLVSITFFTSPKLEVGLLALAIAGLAVALLTRTVRFHRTALVIVAVMTLVWLALPAIAMGASYIDYRFPWAISFFVLAGLIPDPAHRRWAGPLTAVFAGLTVARIATIAGLWLSWEPTFSAIDQALSHLPIGSRLTVIEGQPASGVPFRDPDMNTVAGYAVARRQAFQPGMFASIPGQILYFQPHYRALFLKADWYTTGLPSTLDRIDPDYDYVLELVPSLAHIAPGLPLACEASGPHFALFKVVREGEVRSADPGSCLNPPTR